MATSFGHDRSARTELRVLRGRWLLCVAAFTVGAGMMVLGSRERSDLIAPGSLSWPHAQVLHSAGTTRCAACHPGGEEGLEEIASAAWRNATGSSTPSNDQQSLRCLACHQSLATGDAEPLLAHGLPRDALESESPGPRLRFASALLGSPARGRSQDDPLACALCHQEHNGSRHNLAAMSNDRCQACHTERHSSFAEGHPELNNWPSRRRTRIEFNHASHRDLHFAKTNRAFDCRVCHTADPAGDLTARPGYAASCGACHDADLRRTLAEGLPVLALPSIDDRALSGAGHDIKEWPDSLRGDFDGEAPPIMKLLLAADPSAARAMNRLGERFSFFDVDATDTESLAEAAVLISDLRTLLEELQEEGHTAIGHRLRRLLHKNPESVADYLGRLPPELIDRAVADWFGQGESVDPYDEIENRRAGGGWRIDTERGELRYHPFGHDDPLMRAWLDVIVSLPPEHHNLRDACLEEFTRPEAPGRCLDCHSVEEAENGRLTINWIGRDRTSEPRGFTRFSHRPHLLQPQLADCTACHSIDPAADLKTTYRGHDPTRWTSEFVALKKADCASCHTRGAASDRCTECHHYHIDPASLESPQVFYKSELPSQLNPAAGDVVRPL